ncbi:helix-turn-helix domain-containing protein [Microbispora camponoti]|uniref:Helix-turn-helix domain-containing protein n=3 Tax=Microbispora bryophytorum TaxID=1460882 RepID=A0ABR8LCE6_9ACTN|nr:helix-turn-helix domain-containing protein [Microbispora camponoti]
MVSKSRQASLFDSASAGMVADAFDAARLTQARLRRGMSKQELADKLGVSPAAIGYYEAGINAPRPDHLGQLANILGYPVEFFAAGRPHARLDASMAHFRSLRSTRVGQRAKAIALVEQLWELTYALELRVELPFADVPMMAARSAGGSVEPEEAASELRKRWNIPRGPFRHLVRTMELHGIVVSLFSFAGDDVARVDAFSTSKLPRPLVVLAPDRANDIYRHRFTAAHELGHLVLHRDVAPGDLEQEREADRFAAEVLTPASEIERELSPRLRIPSLEESGRMWGVSVDCLIRRSRELGMVSEVSARRAYQRLQQLRGAGLLNPEPISRFPGEVPTLLKSAYELAEQHGLTIKQLARDLAWPVSQVRELLGEASIRPVLRLV